MKKCITYRGMRAFIISIFVLFSLFTAGKLKAETLHDVVASEAYQKVERDTLVEVSRRQAKDNNANWLREIQPGSNFAMLFENSHGPQLLTRWLNAQHTTFKVVEDTSRRRQDVALAQMELRGKLGEMLTLTVYVPHPTYYPMVQLKVVKEYSEMEPPLLPVTNEENVDINGIKAKLYYTKNAGCSLLMKLDKYSIVRVRAPECRFAMSLPDFARQLDFERFKKKINS